MRPTSQQYFYHPDHLGSSSFISDASGEACQFLAYLPYGEQWVDQRSSGSYDAPYKFSGKELDAETGYNYFGARYYNSGLSVWLSVDPLAASYPGFSPYLYCAGSPLNCVDPDGQRINWLHFIGAMKFRHDCMGTKVGQQIWKDMRNSSSWYSFRYTRAVLIGTSGNGYYVVDGQMVPSRGETVAEMVYNGRPYNGLTNAKTYPFQIQVSTGSYRFWQDFDAQIPQNATNAQKAALVEQMINSGDYKLKEALRWRIRDGKRFNIFLARVQPGEIDMILGSPEGDINIEKPLANETISEFRQRVSAHEAGHALKYTQDFRESGINKIPFGILSETSAQRLAAQVIEIQKENREK